MDDVEKNEKKLMELVCLIQEKKKRKKHIDEHNLCKEIKEAIHVFLDEHENEESNSSHNVHKIKKLISIYNKGQTEKGGNGAAYKWVYNNFEVDINHHFTKKTKEILSSTYININCGNVKQKNNMNHLILSSTNIQKGLYENIEIQNIRNCHNAALSFEPTTWNINEMECDSLLSSDENELDQQNVLKEITQKGKVLFY